MNYWLSATMSSDIQICFSAFFSQKTEKKRSPMFPFALRGEPLLPVPRRTFFSFTFAWRCSCSVIISLTPLIPASLRIDCFSQFCSFRIVPHATERSFQTQRGAAARRRRSLNKVIDFGNNPLTTVTPQKTG